MTPPANEQTVGLTQLEAPPSRLRQQEVPPVHDPLSRQPMLAPPGQVALASMHIVEFGWKQHDCTPGTQAV